MINENLFSLKKKKIVPVMVSSTEWNGVVVDAVLVVRVGPSSPSTSSWYSSSSSSPSKPMVADAIYRVIADLIISLMLLFRFWNI